MMQYQQDTIPVWEAMEQQLPCPLCGLAHKLEQEMINRTLGASVMEPDERIRFNRLGACKRHQSMLFAAQNRLGHALLIDSHLKKRRAALVTVRARIGKVGFLRRGADLPGIAATLQTMASGCVVCDAVDTHMARYRRTFLYLWKTSDAFRAAWQQSQGVCLPHAAALLNDAAHMLSPQKQAQFAAEVLDRLSQQLETDAKDLDWFTRKFDYRNQNEPWGNSKTALERAVNRLRGYCLGEPPSIPTK